MDDDDPDHWAPEHLQWMLGAAKDDVAAFLIAAQALHPAEVRALAAHLGLPDLDNLRELTLTVVLAARHLTGPAAAELRAFAGGWATNRAATVRAYKAKQRQARAARGEQ